MRSAAKVTPEYRRPRSLEGLSGEALDLARQVNRLVEEADIADRLLGQVQVDLNGTNTLYRKQLHSLGAFKRMARTLIGRCDVRDICDKIVEAIAEEMAVERCSIMLLDPTGTELRLESGASCRGIPEREGHGPARVLRMGEGIAGEAARTLRTIHVEDASLDPRFIGFHDAVLVRSLVCIPLVESPGNLLGVLNLSHSEPGFFKGEHMQIFEMLCPLISQLLAFSQLHTRLREMNDGLEMELRSLAENLPDGVARLDRGLRYVYVNGQIALQTGIPTSAFIGRTSAEVGLPRSFVEFFDRELRQAFTGREPVTVCFELSKPGGAPSGAPGSGNVGPVSAPGGPGHPPPGGPRSFEARMVPEVTKDGVVGSVLCITRDITERKALEEQLRVSQRMDAIGRLAGGVAHDFNNLLTGIQGYTEMMLDQVPAAHPLHGDLCEVRKGSERAASLTRQLLAFSRKQVLEPKVLDLNAIIRNTDKMLRRLIGEHIEVITVLPESLGRIRIDPGQLEQVIMNLAVNARDAMPDGGKLILETTDVDVTEVMIDRHARVAPGGYVLLVVSDSGTGIDPEVQVRIFEPFFTTKEQGKGTGLGLSTVHGIVTQSGGQISVYSEVGHGTTFKIYFPRLGAEMGPDEAVALASLGRRGHETVLLAEDDPVVSAVVTKMLRRQGYVVLPALNPAEAIGIFEARPGSIDLLLTDMVMPGGGGAALADKLHARRADLKVLFMSGYTDNVMLQRGMLDPGQAFIQKPFSPESLSRKVRELLEAHAGEAGEPALAPDPPGAGGQERRKHERFSFDLAVVVACEGEVITMAARDIGAGGMFLHSPNPPRLGSQVEVQFNLGRGERHTIRGTVVRHESLDSLPSRQGFAIHFDVTEAERTRLESALVGQIPAAAASGRGFRTATLVP